MTAEKGGYSRADWLECWKREIFDQNSRVNEDIYTLVTRAITNTHLSFSVFKLPWHWRPWKEPRSRSRGRRKSRSRKPQDLRHRISKSLNRPRSRPPTRSPSPKSTDKRRRTRSITPPRRVKEVETPSNEEIAKDKPPSEYKIPKLDVTRVVPCSSGS